MDNKTIDYDYGSYALKYKRHYITDSYDILDTYEAGAAVIIVFDFTNKSGQTYLNRGELQLMFDMYVFQNGISLERDTFNPDEMYSRSQRSVQDGYTLEFGAAFKLEDMSDISIEVAYDKNNILTQTISLSDCEDHRVNDAASYSGGYEGEVDEEGYGDDDISRLDGIFDVDEGELEVGTDYDAEALDLDMEVEDAIIAAGGDPYNIDDVRDFLSGDIFDLSDNGYDDDL